MTIAFLNEFEIDRKTRAEIADLLAVCFPDTDYNNRTFFKQLPHYRLLLTHNDVVIGQLAIDHRTMNLNQELINVFGVIDLAVHPDLQGQGLGTRLLKEFDAIADRHAENIDFTFLATDRPAFYARLGYQKATVTTTWLKIDQGMNHGIGKERIEDAFLMYRQVGTRPWVDGELDLLGYMY